MLQAYSSRQTQLLSCCEKLSFLNYIRACPHKQLCLFSNSQMQVKPLTSSQLSSVFKLNRNLIALDLSQSFKNIALKLLGAALSSCKAEIKIYQQHFGMNTHPPKNRKSSGFATTGATRDVLYKRLKIGFQHIISMYCTGIHPSLYQTQVCYIQTSSSLSTLRIIES